MPKEQKKRGRREEKKRKRQTEYFDGNERHKNIRTTWEEPKPVVGDVEEPFQLRSEDYAGSEALSFYGLLDEQEQEYFKRADSMLELNQFVDLQERDLFLANVYEEANGKELKIANSQSCSRLMEKMILHSTIDQLTAVFQKFSGHFLDLVQHRFASHCCEALFVQAASLISVETQSSFDLNQRGPNVIMESLVLSVVAELEPQSGYLLSHVFASHPLRILLVVLSGLPLAASGAMVPLQSRKKENISIANRPVVNEDGIVPRTVPHSFSSAVYTIQNSILVRLDTTSVRALATQPIANPVLQILLRIELLSCGKRSAKQSSPLLRKLIPDDPLLEGTESAAFVTHLLYDPVGSRLLETIVTCSPGKTFRAIYRNLLQKKLGKIAKNETAVFVIIKLIERLGRDDLQSAVVQICPCIDILIKRSRTAVIRALVERSRVREVDTQPIADALQRCYGDGLYQKLRDMLEVGSDFTEGMAADRKRQQLEPDDIGKTHASLLAQTMLEEPGPLRELVNTALLSADLVEIKMIAKDRSASRVLQAALTCNEQSVSLRRLFIQRILGNITDLAIDPVASHVVDALWEGSSGLKFLRENIAEEMTKSEAALRDSMSGRAVWRNWSMDLYKSRRREWGILKENKPSKTGLDLAMERYANKSIHRQSSTRNLPNSQSKAKIDG